MGGWAFGAYERCLQSCANVALAGGLDLLCEDGADLLALLCEQHTTDEPADAGVARLADGLELAEESTWLVYIGIYSACCLMTTLWEAGKYSRLTK